MPSEDGAGAVSATGRTGVLTTTAGAGARYGRTSTAAGADVKLMTDVGTKTATGKTEKSSKCTISVMEPPSFRAVFAVASKGSAAAVARFREHDFCGIADTSEGADGTEPGSGAKNSENVVVLCVQVPKSNLNAQRSDGALNRNHDGSSQREQNIGHVWLRIFEFQKCTHLAKATTLLLWFR